jgi:hypothetical protein
MNFSLQPDRASDAGAVALAGRLLGGPVLAAWPVSGGGNNRIFLIDAHEACYALKLYATQPDDGRDRLGTEFRAATLLHEAGIAEVPAPVAVDHAAGAALYEWVDGGPVDAVGEAEIDAALALLQRLQGLSRRVAAGDAAPASAACLAPADAFSQIDERFCRLSRAVASPPAALRRFLDDEFAPVHHILTRAAAHRLARAGIPADRPLAAAHRLLSPSDFGFHNALRRPDGRIVFVDLEYFGWDDPAKLVSDFLLHPGHALPAPQGARFERAARAQFRLADPQFDERLSALRPLYGLCWCLILLNEFLPEVRARRGLHDDAAAQAAQAAQLAKARTLLLRLWSDYESCHPAS